MRIKKNCEWCGEPFIAQTSTTKYCSKGCEDRAITASKQPVSADGETSNAPDSIDYSALATKEYLTPTELAQLLQLGRSTIYRYIQDGIIPALQLPGKTLVWRKALEALFDNAPAYTKRTYHRKTKKD